MATYAKHVAVRGPGKTRTPQTKKARQDQVRNDAGGYVFKVDPFTQLVRFLILGTEGGSYYVSEKTQTVRNFENIRYLLGENGVQMVDLIVEISTSGRAPKNIPAVFALAVTSVFGDDATRAHAHSAMPKVARTGTDLFIWRDAVDQLKDGKVSTGLMRALGRWYTGKTAAKVVYQVCKYPQRTGQQMAQRWSHRDILRQIRPGPDHRFGPALTTPSDAHNLAFKYAVQGREGFDDEAFAALRGNDDLKYIWAHEAAKSATTADQIVELIDEFGITRESIPNTLFTAKVWKKMLDKGMPMTAMVRNLGAMTAVDVLKPLGTPLQKVVAALTDEEALAKARIHPIGVLIAMEGYRQGHGASVDRKTGRHRVTWKPVPAVLDALNDAFYKSFKFVEPADKNFLIGVDVSGSMVCNPCVGSPMISANMAAAAMAMSIAKTEPNCYVHGFADTFRDLGITPAMRLDQIVKRTKNLSFGGTNCSLPMQHATRERLDVDTFVVLTDNETWYGNVHPYEALAEYRDRFNKEARLVVMAFTATEFSIANGVTSGYMRGRQTNRKFPQDPGSLDVAGLDSAAPKIVSDFAAGRV